MKREQSKGKYGEKRRKTEERRKRSGRKKREAAGGRGGRRRGGIFLELFLFSLVVFDFGFPSHFW